MAWASNERRREYDHGRVRSEEEKAYQREWMRKYRQCPEVRAKQSKATRDWQKRNPVNYGFNNDRQSAIKRDYEWGLTKEEYEALIFGDCTYCGIPANPVNGIDRVDNTKGYITENSVSSCFNCNRAKSTLAIEDFTKWLDRLVNFRQNKR